MNMKLDAVRFRSGVKACDKFEKFNFLCFCKLDGVVALTYFFFGGGDVTLIYATQKKNVIQVIKLYFN